MNTSWIIAALIAVPLASSAKIDPDSSKTQVAEEVAEAKVMGDVSIAQLQTGDHFDFPTKFTFTKNSEGKYVVDFEENICAGELKDSGKQLSTVFLSQSPKWKLESKERVSIKVTELKLVERDKPQSKASIIITCNANKNGISPNFNVADVLKSKGVKISREKNAKFAEAAEQVDKKGKPVMDGIKDHRDQKPGTK